MADSVPKIQLPVLPGWDREFENLLIALTEEGKRQRREEEMRAHVRLLNAIYLSVNMPTIQTEVR